MTEELGHVETSVDAVVPTVHPNPAVGEVSSALGSGNVYRPFQGKK